MPGSFETDPAGMPDASGTPPGQLLILAAEKFSSSLHQIELPSAA